MQYLIIFSCGWVINHFGFNLLRCYCCCWCCCFSVFLLRCCCSSFSILFIGHRAKALTVFSFALLSTFSPTYTFIVKSMFRNHVYYCVDLSIFIGYRVHFHSVFVQCLGIRTACQHDYTHTLLFEIRCVSIHWNKACSHNSVIGLFSYWHTPHNKHTSSNVGCGKP